ncbi:pericentriolar material 1 protein-like [Scleropages formosus]|uniref:Pericentriolar material 1 protein-like n=1 Tax=Scleropages formosus TaxID=113540 RepID=A0A0P7V5G0_SCLFO|nr:pericentriolar material 1 protein-like [Scleropages formosus]
MMNKKKVGEAAESRLTNGISPESTPGTGRRRARTPHSYGTQMSVPEQAELERLRQRINFTDLDQRSIGSDSQGRVTAANNQRQLAENKKAFNFLPLRVNTNNSKQPPPVAASPSKEVPSRPERGSPAVADGNGDTGIDSSQIVSKLVQIREYIGKASTMRDDLVEKSDVPANVERLSHLIDHLKQQEKSYLRFLQKMLAREDEEDDLRALDSPAGSSLAAEGTSLNVQFPSEGSRSASRDARSAAAKEDLENLHKQQDLLKKMLEQQEQLRALQGRQVALLAMQHKAPQASAADDTIITETTGSVSGLSITSELNDELNDLIQRFHNQLHDTQTKTVPDNRRQAESLSLSWEASRGRTPSTVTTAAASSKRATLKELQDKKETMDKILQELHALRDQTLNNSSCKQLCVDHRGIASTGSAERSSAFGRESSARVTPALDPNSYPEGSASPGAKLRKLKEVHTRLNELRELVQYYEQTSDMMVDTVNENIRDEEEESEDGSIFETIFDSEQENREPATNLRNPKCSSNWMDMNSLASARCSNNREGRLNTECEINNRSAANLRSLNTPKVIECQYNRDRSYNDVKDNEDEEEEGMEDEDDVREQRGDSEGSVSSRRSSLGEDPEFVQKVHRLQTAKEKLRQLQELVAMVQSDDTDATTGNEEDNPKQRPNNARIPASKSPKDAEKLYEARLREQQQELKRLQDERLRLMEIQGKIQDLQWACPELQSSVSSMSEQGLNKAPAATSTPSVNVGVTRPKPVTAASAPDNELWSEMRRHQIQREELRNRRKQLESLMAEHQRRSGLADVGVSQHASLLLNRDERTMATWGDSTQSHQNEEDDNPSEMEAREGEDEGGDYSSGEDVATYPDRKGQPYSARASRGSGFKATNPFSVDGAGRSSSQPRPDSRTKMRSKRSHDSGGMKRQENLRWASDLSFTEGRRHWQEQVAQLKKQLDFSTSMCQTLMQDQQTLSYMLQTLLSSPYSLLPSSVGSPQLHFVMHQLHQCYTQLAWQQSNVQRLRQVLDQLIRQQQSQSSGAVSPSLFAPFGLPPPPPPPMSTLGMPGFASFSPLSSGMAFDPIFTPAVGEFTRTPVPHGGSTSQPQQTPTEHNTSAKTEYMGFPQAFDRSPHSGADSWSRKDGEASGPSGREEPKAPGFQSRRDSSGQRSSHVPQQAPSQPKEQGSLESLSSMPDPTDPTTVTKTFRTGGKASAQASLASRDKTPSSKGKRRRNKGHVKAQGVGSDGASSGTESVQVRAKSTKLKEPDQGLLDRLTRAKLDGKASVHKTNDLSSACSPRAPIHSNSFACAPDASSDFSLFEALRETIYSEVATLISQNESRPHFLIELFHELQLLNTDYLRQRALFSLQDIVSRHLTESKVNGEQPLPMGHGAWATASNSELTPSESLATSDTDVSEKNCRSKFNLGRKQNESMEKDDQSTLSSYFASSDLGNTVIHMDKTTAHTKLYEHSKLQAESNSSGADATAAAHHAAAQLLEGASDNTNVHCPQIDTQQLDRQIKGIMTEVIPVLKEHMDEVCSPQLLSSIRRMVLELTQHDDDSKEFVRFFHRQLGGILQDSLSRFAGRTLKECGEDLLVEISEILFNELAFFRLMQDLDAGGAGRQKTKKKVAGPRVPKVEGNQCWEAEKSQSSACYNEEDKHVENMEQEDAAANLRQDKGTGVRGEGSAGPSDKEEEEDEEDGRVLPLSISLSKAETQPLTNYGSGEDEGEEEELEEFDAGPVDVQTSLQASQDTPCVEEQGKNEVLDSSSREEKADLETTDSTDVKSSKPESTKVEDISGTEAGKGDMASCPGGNESTQAESGALSPRSSSACSPDTDSPVMINEHEVGSANLSQKSDEEDFVKVEDLPLQLSVMCKEELQKRIAEEQLNNNLSTEILNGNVGEVLVGNSQTLKEPGVGAVADVGLQAALRHVHERRVGGQLEPDDMEGETVVKVLNKGPVHDTHSQMSRLSTLDLVITQP